MSESGEEHRVYGGRYEIERKIARGGMADVFLARDQLLDRPVALKVLFPELSIDPSFVERFRREAQNAARLSHPNIVSVYDWGEEDNVYYIVMEFVDGRPLSVILREDGPLAARRAAEIGGDVASALSFAHQNGVVHRDVKPGNVLIDERGGVKVTDFGIARARNTKENLTQTGAVMGTATYFSPEQAQGLPVDQRSDVYSLGVVLYEMVAGKPPFQGDNAVTIAYKHVRETPPPLSEIAPSVPRPFEAIVTEAMAKSAVNRYATAEDLRADLERFNSGHAVRATAIAPPIDATQAVGRQRTLEDAYADSTRTIPSVRPTPAPVRLPPEDRGIAGPLAGFLAVLALLAIVAFLLFWTNGFGGDDNDQPVTVPSLVNRPLPDVEAELERLGLESDITREENDAPRDTVVAQDPGPAAVVREGDTIRLTVSDGPPPVALPDVVNQTQDQATTALRALGLNVTVTQASSDTVERGRVISTDPPPRQQVEKGSTVTITVSTGRQQVEVPDVRGFTASGAAQRLDEAGLRTNRASQDSDQPEGVVISTDPPAGTRVPEDTVVTITVSTGRSTTTTTTEARNGNGNGGNGGGGGGNGGGSTTTGGGDGGDE